MGPLIDNDTAHVVRLLEQAPGELQAALDSCFRSVQGLVQSATHNWDPAGTWHVNALARGRFAGSAVIRTQTRQARSTMKA
jgi:hypothetical protein